MKKKNLKIVTPKNIILLIVTCILIHILYISPMMSDDFEFASYHFNNIGKIMRYSLYYGNGRLLGNIGACILNNNKILCVIVKVVMILAMMLLIPKVINIKNRVLEYVIYLMILGTAPEIFGQVDFKIIFHQLCLCLRACGFAKVIQEKALNYFVLELWDL